MPDQKLDEKTYRDAWNAAICMFFQSLNAGDPLGETQKESRSFGLWASDGTVLAGHVSSVLRVAKNHFIRCTAHALHVHNGVL